MVTRRNKKINIVDKLDGDDWWDYDVYLFDKIESKVIFLTKDNLFHDLTYNHMELHYNYNISVMFVWLDKILNDYNKPIYTGSCEEEIGFKYIPTDYKTFTSEELFNLKN